MNSAMDGASDALYQLEVALHHAKHELNEHRDAQLTEAELIALLDTYSEMGR